MGQSLENEQKFGVELVKSLHKLKLADEVEENEEEGKEMGGNGEEVNIFVTFIHKNIFNLRILSVKSRSFCIKSKIL